MNANGKRTPPHNTPLKSMNRAVVISFALHIVGIIVLIVGVPHLRPDPIIPTPISVELATIADMTQSNKPPQKVPDKKDEPPKKVEKPKAKPNPSKEPPKLDQVNPDAKKPVEVKKDAPVQDELALPKKTDKKPDKKPEKKEDPKENPQFSSLLKNLTKDEPQDKSDIGEITKKLASAEPAPETPNLGQQLTMSDIDALRQQLAGCWNVFAGAAEAQDLAVDIRVIVNSDRTVQRATIVETIRYNNDDRYRAAADSALRALRDPRCTPLNLPPDKYTLWRDMIVTFDPKDML